MYASSFDLSKFCAMQKVHEVMKKGFPLERALVCVINSTDNTREWEPFASFSATNNICRLLYGMPGAGNLRGWLDSRSG